MCPENVHRWSDFSDASNGDALLPVLAIRCSHKLLHYYWHALALP